MFQTTHPLQTTASMGQGFPGSAVQVPNQYGSHQPSPTFHSNQSHTYPPVVPPPIHPYTPQGGAVHTPLPPSPYNVSSPSMPPQYPTPGIPPKTYSPAPPPVNPVQPLASQGVGQLHHSPAPSAGASQGNSEQYKLVGFKNLLLNGILVY